MSGPRFDVITLFPDQFPNLLELGVVGRALKKQLFELHCWNPRDFTDDLQRTVDDRPYGDQAPVIFLTPHGPLLKQADVRAMSEQGMGAILLCGRYEGVDQRFIDEYVDQTYCLGDFVLSGGELAVACFVDAWVRLVPDVLNHALSATQDSFEAGLLDCPHYTRPEVFENKAVPDVLLSGNHAKIDSWRFEQAKAYTKRFRPELLENLVTNSNERAVKNSKKG